MMNPEVERRMVRKRLIEALRRHDDWRIESRERVVRLSDGLWVNRTVHGSRGDSGVFEIGSPDHGVPQAVVQFEGGYNTSTIGQFVNYKDEANHAFLELIELAKAGSTRNRPVLELLGVK